MTLKREKIGEESFQNWKKEFEKFWPEHPEVSKLLTFMVSVWAKKSTEELSSMALKNDAKFEENWLEV